MLHISRVKVKAIVRGVPNWMHIKCKRLAACSDRYCTVLFCLHSSGRFLYLLYCQERIKMTTVLRRIYNRVQEQIPEIDRNQITNK